MQIRSCFYMPSCANQLESNYDHFNVMTPRRNMHWPSLFRITKETLKKIHGFEANFIHNYSNFKRKIKKL